MERTKRVKMFRVRLRLRLRFRPRFCRRQSIDYQQFGDRETLTISMWSTDGVGAGAGGTGGNMDFRRKWSAVRQSSRLRARTIVVTSLQQHNSTESPWTMIPFTSEFKIKNYFRSCDLASVIMIKATLQALCYRHATRKYRYFSIQLSCDSFLATLVVLTV